MKLKEKLNKIENELKIISEKKDSVLIKLKHVPQYRETGEVFPDRLEMFLLLKEEMEQLDDCYLSLRSEKDLIMKKLRQK